MDRSSRIHVDRRSAIKRMALITGGLAFGLDVAAARIVGAQVDELCASGSGVNVKHMPDPTGQSLVALRESFGFDGHYAQWMIEDNPCCLCDGDVRHGRGGH